MYVVPPGIHNLIHLCHYDPIHLRYKRVMHLGSVTVWAVVVIVVCSVWHCRTVQSASEQPSQLVDGKESTVLPN